MRTTLVISLSIVVATLSGCHRGTPDPREAEAYSIATSQLPVELSGNRLREGRPPAPIVSANSAEPRLGAVPLIMPVMQFSLGPTNLGRAAHVLAKSVGYRAFVASAVEGRRVSLKTVATMEEAAHQLAEKAGATVVIDHENEVIRFFPL